MSAPGTVRAIQAHWARRLHCDVSELLQPGILVLPFGPRDDWHGSFLLCHANTCIIAVPPAMHLRVRARTAGRTAHHVFSVAYLYELFGGQIESTVGPAWLGYADRTDIRPIRARGVRLLTADDRSALESLQGACGEEGWEHSGIAADRPPIFGRFVADTLVAAGTLEDVGEGLRNVGIVTHPDHRRQGHGKAVVSVMSEHAIKEGAALQYRTLVTNLPSVGIASSLGYHKWGESLAVRLRPA